MGPGVARRIAISAFGPTWADAARVETLELTLAADGVLREAGWPAEFDLPLVESESWLAGWLPATKRRAKLARDVDGFRVLEDA